MSSRSFFRLLAKGPSASSQLRNAGRLFSSSTSSTRRSMLPGVNYLGVGVGVGVAIMAGGVTYMYQHTGNFIEAETATRDSVYDLLKDIQDRLAKIEAVVLPEKLNNSAFVFIKPHAATQKVEELVKDTFDLYGIKVTGEGDLDGETIAENLLIDNHYYAIAKRASLAKPADLNPLEEKQKEFADKFGLAWSEALKKGIVLNAVDACEKLGIDGDELNSRWAKAKNDKKLVKFGGGFYAGKVGEIFVINGFYMAMREKFTKPGCRLHWLTVEWPLPSDQNAVKLSWEGFRGQVLGGTDPAIAATASLRRQILDKFESLDLTSQPNIGDNGVHASASPFEAMAERMNWLGVKLEDDHFGKKLIEAGIPSKMILGWTLDPPVVFEGKKQSLFDLLEDLDADACLEKAKEIANQQMATIYLHPQS